MNTVAPLGDMLPTTFNPPPTRTDTDSWIGVVANIVQFAREIADTEFVPRGIRGSAAATAAAMLYGREIGLPPMTALSATHVVDGRPAISAEAMRALVIAAGHELAFGTMSGGECTIRGRRRGTDTWTTVRWDLAMARAAGLLDKKGETWRRYPRAMLAARATAELCRLIFPDVIHGFAAVEEIDGSDAPVSAAEPSVEQSPARKPVRRARRPVASPTASRAAPPVPPSETAPVLLPGDPGYDDDAGSGGVDTLTPPDSPIDPEQPPLPLDIPEPEPVDDLAPEPVDDLAPEPAPAPVPLAPRLIGRPQHRMLMALLADLEITTHDDRVDVLTVLTGRKVESSLEISADEANKVIATLGTVQTGDQLAALCSELIAEQARRAEHERDGDT